MYTNSKSSPYNGSLTLSPCTLCSRDECRFPTTCHGDPWKSLLLLVQRADHRMYKHKKEDLDSYFHYGILIFSCNATILADSYKWVTKYAPYSFIAKFCHVRDESLDSSAQFIPYDAAIIIVALWAVSLLLTSTTLLMCHLGRQWLREFVNQPQFSHKNQLAFRQIHYDSLCRWQFFAICDVIPFLLPFGATFFIAGLIMFLWQLNHPDASLLLGVSCVLFVYYLIVALHPLFCFLIAKQDGLTSELSPFRSPSSWFFFKLGNWLVFMNRIHFTSYWTQQKRALPQLRGQRPLLPTHSDVKKPPTRTKSIDWLEQDCSLFIHENDTQDIDATLINALIWIDSNPTIEKTIKVVVSIYHCISDLHLAHILPRFKEGCTRSASGLSEIIIDASQKCTDVNDPVAAAFVMKRWLELHIKRLPELRTQLAELHVHCVDEIGKTFDYARLGFNSFDAFLLRNAFFIPSGTEKRPSGDSGHRLPAKILRSLLVIARNGLANGIYYEGTFKLISQVIFQFQDSASKRQINLVLAILAGCRRFEHSLRGSGLDEQQAQRFTSEFGEFILNVNAIDCDFDHTNCVRSWSPHSSDIWKEILTIANEVDSMGNVSLQGSSRNMFPASPTEELVDPIYDGICSVSITESFDSMQFELESLSPTLQLKTF